MRRFLCFLALLLQIVTWVPVKGRHLATYHPHSSSQQLLGNVTSPLSSQAPPHIPKQNSQENAEKSVAVDYGRGMNTLGSRPPNCQHKCYGCTPCIAIQVPTVTGRLGIQYANYEPESWKCKCGPSIYTP